MSGWLIHVPTFAFSFSLSILSGLGDGWGCRPAEKNPFESSLRELGSNLLQVSRCNLTLLPTTLQLVPSLRFVRFVMLISSKIIRK